MGTLAGHLAPGSFFFILAMAWATTTFRKYSRSINQKKPFESFIWTANEGGRIRTLPWCWFSTVICTLLIIGEFVTALEPEGFALGNGQHMVMLTCLLVHSVISLLMFHGCRLLPRADYISLVIATTVTAIMFYSHRFGKSSLENDIHAFLISVFLCFIPVISLETFSPHTVVFSALRAYLMLLLSTWFCHAGFVLYPPVASLPRYGPEDHHARIIISISFGAHILVDFLIILLVFGLMNRREKEPRYSNLIINHSEVEKFIPP